MGDSDGFHPQDPKRRSTAGSRRFSRAPKLGKFKSAPTFTPDPTFHKGTFRVLRNINAHEGAVHHTHLSQGSTLLSCGADGTAKRFDLEAGAVTAVYKGHKGVVWDVKADKAKVVTASADHTIGVFKTFGSESTKANVRPSALMVGHKSWVTCLEYYGTSLYSGSRDKTVKVWDFEKQVCVSTFDDSEDMISALVDVDDVPDSVATGCYDKKVRVYDTRSNPTGGSAVTFSGHTGGVWAIQADGNYVVSGSTDGTVRVWDMRQRKAMFVIPGHNGGVLSLQYDHLKLVSGGDDGTIKVWDLSAPDEPECVRNVRAFPDNAWVRTLHFDRHGHMVTGSSEGLVRLWDCVIKEDALDNAIKKTRKRSRSKRKGSKRKKTVSSPPQTASGESDAPPDAPVAPPTPTPEGEKTDPPAEGEAAGENEVAAADEVKEGDEATTETTTESSPAPIEEKEVPAVPDAPSGETAESGSGEEEKKKESDVGEPSKKTENGELVVEDAEPADPEDDILNSVIDGDEDIAQAREDQKAKCTIQ